MTDSIWFKPPSLDEINSRGLDSMVEHLAIDFTDVGPDFLTAVMPVDQRTRQPLGLLHGGASAALAETVASTAANFCVDSDRKICVGMEINANHLKSVRDGLVRATASPIHLGRSSQVWEIRIQDEDERLVAVSRLTLAVIDRRSR